ncbi:MAG TPA: hypothetical protein VGK24_02340 [Candidatus Angelobacter sp.]
MNLWYAYVVYFGLSVTNVPANCDSDAIRPVVIQNTEEREKGSGIAHDGTALALTKYKSKTGEQVFVTHGKFRSREATQDEIHIRLQRATKIDEHTMRKDSLGNVIGERVLMQLSDQQHRKYYSILWTQDRELYALSSPLLQPVLEAEKCLIAHECPDRSVQNK